jgi:hypothetical protein
MQTGMVLTQRSRLPLGIDAGSHPVLEPFKSWIFMPGAMKHFYMHSRKHASMDRTT